MTRLLLSQLPNLISLARLLSAPVIIWLLLNAEYTTAFWLFVVAGISDGVDGFIAKRFHAESTLGGYLDPIADKALLVGVYGMAGFQGHLPMGLVILVMFRDVLIVGGAILVETVTHQLRMAPLFISKINTVAQIVLAAFVLAQLGFDFDTPKLMPAFVLVVGATTLASGAAYLYQYIFQLIREEDLK